MYSCLICDFPRTLSIFYYIRTMHVIKVQWINFKKSKKQKRKEKKKSNTKNRRWFWPQTETLVKVLFMSNASFSAHHRTVDDVIDSDAMATGIWWKRLFQWEAPYSGDLYCMNVCVCGEGKVLILGLDYDVKILSFLFIYLFIFLRWR